MSGCEEQAISSGFQGLRVESCELRVAGCGPYELTNAEGVPSSVAILLFSDRGHRAKRRAHRVKTGALMLMSSDAHELNC